MKICCVLLVSLVSVFHLSHADQPVEEPVVVARNVQLLGGWSDANPQRADVQTAAKKAVERFNTKSKANNYFKLTSIISAKAQVTNKINYQIEAIIGKTKCSKSENVDMESCVMAKKQLRCRFDVTLNPRNDKHEMKMMSCQKFS